MFLPRGDSHGGGEVRVETPEEQRPPYLEEELLELGACSKIYKVRIAKGHFYDSQTRAANLEAVEVPRKDYYINFMFPARVHQLMKILAISDQRCPNVVQDYSSLKVGSAYSLFPSPFVTSGPTCLSL